jgi:hypothetical protein
LLDFIFGEFGFENSPFDENVRNYFFQACHDASLNRSLR